MKNRTFLAASVARFASLISSPGGGGLLCLLLCAGVAIQASAQTTPTASLATAASSVDEDMGTVTVTVNLSSALSSALSDAERRISYSLSSDANTASLADYTDPQRDPQGVLSPGYVYLADGATSVNIEIEIEDDDIPEDDETLVVTLQDGDGGIYAAGSPNTHTITIVDNDDPVVGFVPVQVLDDQGDPVEDDQGNHVYAFASGLEEDAGFADLITVEIKPQHESISDLDIGYTVTGTATFDASATSSMNPFQYGGDFGIAGLTNVNDAEVTVSSFTTQAFIDVAINDDEAEEGAETVILTLVDGDGYTVASDSSVFTITIEKNDEGAPPVVKPTISITGTQAVFNEGDLLTVNVNSTIAVAADLTVTLRVSDAAGSDFLDASYEGDKTATIPSGQTTVAFPLKTGHPMNEDEGNAVYDAPGTIMVTLAPGADYDVDATASSVSMAGTDPDGPFVSFAAASGTIEEGARQEKTGMAGVYEAVYHDFVVNIEPATLEPIEISFTIKDEGEDDGTTAINDDYIVDFGDGFYATTSSVDVGVSMFTAQLSTCQISTSGLCPITANTDVFAEGPERVIFEIVDGAVNDQAYRLGTQTTHSVTIEDNEVTASFASASTVVEETVGTFDVTVNLDKAPERPIQIRYSVTEPSTGDNSENLTANDYVITNETIIQGVGAMGATTATISVEIVDDAVMESDETLTLTLLGGKNEQEGAVPYENYLGDIVEHTITIRASDGGTSTTTTTPVASFASASASAAESAGTQNVAINLSPAPSAAITLNYTLSGTATLDADYAISGVTSNNGTVSVNAGDTSVNIPVAITDDSADESNETVILTLASGTGYDVGSAAEYTLTITDNDGGSTTTTPPVTTPPVTTPPATTPPATTVATVTLSASPNPVDEGESVTITVTPSQLLSSDATIPLVLTAGTAEPEEDYSALASIVIEGNEPNGTGVIRARKDVDMDDETFTVSLGTLPSSVVAGTPASVEITIMDVGTVSAEADGQELPDAFALEQNYPNPFNPSTAIEYALPEAAHVLIEVFDATGRSAGVLVDGARPAGRHSARFEAGSLPSGLYVYRMQAGGQTMVRKMTLVR